MATLVRALESQSTWLTDGVTTVWNFSFAGGYIDKSYVKLRLVDIPTGTIIPITIQAGWWTGPNQITTPVYGVGQRLTIYRDTPSDNPLVDFTDKGNVSEVALDTNAKQAVQLAAEAQDSIWLNADTVLASSSASAAAAAASAAAAAGSATTASGYVAATTAAGAAQVALATTQAGNAATSATNAATSAASAAADAATVAGQMATIAGGPVASWAGLTGVISQAAARTALGVLDTPWPAPGLRVSYAGILSLNLLPIPGGGGYVWINGVNRKVTSWAARTPLGSVFATSGNMGYIYAYWDGSEVQLVVNSTVPVKDPVTGIFYQTGDVTRTCLAAYYSYAAYSGNSPNGEIYNFFGRKPVTRTFKTPLLLGNPTVNVTSTTFGSIQTGTMNQASIANVFTWEASDIVYAEAVIAVSSAVVPTVTDTAFAFDTNVDILRVGRVYQDVAARRYNMVVRRAGVLPAPLVRTPVLIHAKVNANTASFAEGPEYQVNVTCDY